MLTPLVLSGLMILGLSCQQAKVDILNDSFPEEQAKITQMIDDIYKSAQQKDIETLQSFHAYGPKFTTFKDGGLREDAEGNKKYEQETFMAISDYQYDIRDLKVSVFGDAAIATFHGFFEANLGDQHIEVQVQGTLAFVKVDGAWKIVHEHFSPLNLPTEQAPKAE